MISMAIGFGLGYSYARWVRPFLAKVKEKLPPEV